MTNQLKSGLNREKKLSEKSLRGREKSAYNFYGLL